MTQFAQDLVYIDLTTKSIKREPCPKDVLRKFLGGRGLGAHLLLKHLHKDTDPLGEENILVFAAGYLTGTRMITSGRLHVAARSPLTGLLGASNGGGSFAPELKACGILALIVSGVSENPVFINIKGDSVTLEDASSLWGLKTTETWIKVKEIINDDKAKVLVIGPAGENLSLGSIRTDEGHFAGRTGMGTVMGAKRLKAVAVRRSDDYKPRSVPGATEAVKEYVDMLKQSPGWEKWTTVGSSCDVSGTDEDGALGTRNYNDVRMPGVVTACGTSFIDAVVRYNRTCFNCPIHCKAEIKISGGRHDGAVIDRPEYETFSVWGPKCGNADGRESVYLNYLCNEYGLDSIETGNMVAFAMDLYNRGIITKEDTGGLDLSWGNIEAMEELVHQLACKSTPLAVILAKGLKEAPKLLGKEAEKYAYHVKGLGLPIMDPRGYKGSGLGYAVGSRGSDFTNVYARPEFSYSPERAKKEFGTENAANRLLEEGKPAVVKASMSASAVVDSLGICKIPVFSISDDFPLEHVARVLSAISGETFTAKELQKTGERIVNAERLVNFRFGATGQDDRLPEKFLREPVKEGPAKGTVINLEPMLREFYAIMGWDENGAVTTEKLKELDLDGYQ